MSATKNLKLSCVLQSFKIPNYNQVTKKKLSSQVGHEVRIPVPWGFVQGKWWGCVDKRPVLAIHGWLDNCGTFDNLAPLLAEKLNLGFLAIDLPGHGLSSNYPIGTYYNLPDSVILIERIKKFMGWNYCSLLGHSLGSSTCYVYSSFFGASNIDLFIALDRMLPPFKEQTNTLFYGKVIENYLRYETMLNDNKPKPTYSHDEGLKKLLNSSYLANISNDNAEILLKRQFLPSTSNSNKFSFNIDPRIKIKYLVHWNAADCLLMAQNLTMPILNMKTDRIKYYDDEETHKKVCEFLARNNQYFCHQKMDLSHFAHLTSPEQIVDPIVEFVTKFDLHDRDQKKDIFKEIEFNCDEKFNKSEGILWKQ